MAVTSKPHVFVSYAHADAELVLPEIRRLQDEGFALWFDEGIRPGAAWRDELADAIEAAGALLLFVSPGANASMHCRQEVEFALEKSVPIIRVHLVGTELSAGLALALGGIQAILKHDLAESDYRTRLSTSLDACLAGHAPAASLQKERDVATTVAVIPFDTHSSDASLEYFGEGLAEDVLNGLVKSGVRVVGRASSFRFSGRSLDVGAVGQQLGATHLLTGSVRIAATRVRVNAELISVADGTTGWSEQYTQDLTDVFEVQDAITAEILDAFEFALEPRKAKVSVPPEAYRAFLLGKHLFARMEFDAAVEAYEDAIRHHPDYASAHMDLANMHFLKVFFWRASMQQEVAEIRACADRALALDPEIVSGVPAALRFYIQKDYQGALDEITLQLSEHPSSQDLLGYFRTFFLCLRRFDLSLRVFERLVELSPVDAFQHRLRAETLVLAKRFDEAEIGLEHIARLGMRDPYMESYLAFSRGDIAGVAALVGDVEGQFGKGHPFHLITQARVRFLEADDAGAEVFMAPVRAFAESAGFHYLRGVSHGLAGNLEGFLAGLRDGLLVGEAPAFQNHVLDGVWVDRFPEIETGGAYQSVLEDVGLSGAQLARLAIPPLPFDK